MIAALNGNGLKHVDSIAVTFRPPDKRRRDKDNMIASFKSGQDGIADALGVDDSTLPVSHETGTPVRGGRVDVVFSCYKETDVDIDALIRRIQHDHFEWRGVLISVCSYCGIVYGAKDAEGTNSGQSHGYCQKCFGNVVRSLR